MAWLTLCSTNTNTRAAFSQSDTIFATLRMYNTFLQHVFFFCDYVSKTLNTLWLPNFIAVCCFLCNSSDVEAWSRPLWHQAERHTGAYQACNVKPSAPDDSDMCEERGGGPDWAVVYMTLTQETGVPFLTKPHLNLPVLARGRAGSGPGANMCFVWCARL